MTYIKSAHTEPYFNLALEQYVFDCLSPEDDYFMLWQNDNAIIIGKHQNTMEEINADFVVEHGIKVARRLSGGGAVYHDLGNLNFTFITGLREGSGGRGFDFRSFCEPIAEALREMGVEAEISGRNDMTIGGKKFSGNAQYVKGGRVMHHGTLLFDSNLDVVSQALKVAPEKVESKGVKSVRSHITNIKPFLPTPLSLGDFWAALERAMGSRFTLTPRELTQEDLAEVRRLRDEVYATWEWNYGFSPAYKVRKSRRVEGCGTIQVFMDIKRGGVIGGVEFYGDYFGNGDSREVAHKLGGHRLMRRVLEKTLAGIDVPHYFSGLDGATLIDILLGKGE
ncbi:MAG: lipoate--protein ligase [Spirochaetaceae bacterium]|jgi:lipoate-protein ligase A|nr:lipoate--protein ligase [Spirochaetaceae bacterium]